MVNPIKDVKLNIVQTTIFFAGISLFINNYDISKTNKINQKIRVVRFIISQR